MDMMLKNYLFGHHILVQESPKIATSEEVFSALFALANEFGIRITKGAQLASLNLIAEAADYLGKYVPEPFYRGFPNSVRELTSEQRLYDQLLSYSRTYGMGWFDRAEHSNLEEAFTRIAFKEDVPVKEFVILPEKEAEKELMSLLRDLLSGTRPINKSQFYNITTAYKLYGGAFIPEDIPCRKTAVDLLYETRDPKFANGLKLSDVIKLLETIQYEAYHSENLKKLNLKNKDRKLIAGVMNQIFTSGISGRVNKRECFEKRKIWIGLLHHIHYKPVNDVAEDFVFDIRNSEINLSPYSMFENQMRRNNRPLAALRLGADKGQSAVLRNLNYILSRCEDDDEIMAVLNTLKKTANPVVLIQLLQQYGCYRNEGGRIFRFNKNGTMRVHKENEKEIAARKSVLNEYVRTSVSLEIRNMISKSLDKRLGKVWIDPDMKHIAVPLQMATGETGFDILPTGSRVPIPQGKKVRAFTYWEKVNDIDISCFAVTEDGKQEEFSWRNMWNKQGADILFSGDQTSGYNGGSEYFDINVEKFRENHPGFRYLVFCDNIYSGAGSIHFKDCFCKAGFMLRDKIDSGEVYEPKTVSTSYKITGDSSFSYLFAIDLKKSEMVWLNVERNGNHAVAGNTTMDVLLPILGSVEVYDVYDMYYDAATELVSDADISEADVIVAAYNKPLPNGYSEEEAVNRGAEVVRVWDIEKMVRVLNKAG